MVEAATSLMSTAFSMNHMDFATKAVEQATRVLGPVESASIGALSGVIEVLLQQPSVTIKNAIQVRLDQREQWLLY